MHWMSPLMTYRTVLLQTSEELEKLEGRKEVLKERKKNASQNKEQLEKPFRRATRKVSLLATMKSIALKVKLGSLKRSDFKLKRSQ